MNLTDLVIPLITILYFAWLYFFRPETRLKRWLFAAVLTLNILFLLMSGFYWYHTLSYLFLILSLLLLKDSPVQKKRNRFLISLNAILITFALLITLALTYYLPVFHFDQTTGEFAVGTEIANIKNNEHDINLQIWYPATASTDGEKAHYMESGPEVTQALAATFGIPGFTLQHLSHVKTNAWMNADISQDGPFPVVLFAHGLGGIRNQNTFQVEELASHGYIVIGIDYPGYAAATVYPDGRVITDEHQHLVGAQVEELDQHIDTWADTSLFVLDQLEDTQPFNHIQQQMDLNHIAFIGHSYGGATAAYLLQKDERIKAAINMDGGLFGLSNELDYTDKPLLLMAADSSLDTDQYLEAVDALTNEQLASIGKTKEELRAHIEELMRRRDLSISHGASTLTISEASHISFADAPLYSSLLAPVVHHEQINHHTLAFLDYHLK
ncbi:alpha/beta fold hydrolase [Jeotgalibacillus sp. R-1-5s-1]|uniref:alpha/beta hydrolase family protein n=1 Tax=Jeotgalibacillus sp. R-1-5s-1 TaxID=2555897 RepID=UPI00141BC2F6|nr:alpha/beta fold hydrolase [Jeotgalibacillus sp. R-1-5s-1]